jgi:hypothetical protein
MSRSKKATLKRKTVATKKDRTATAVPKKSTSAGKSRAEGIRLFNLAGRPTKEQFQLVYGAERGHLMTWKNEPKQACQPKSFRLR